MRVYDKKLIFVMARGRLVVATAAIYGIELIVECVGCPPMRSINYSSSRRLCLAGPVRVAQLGTAGKTQCRDSEAGGPPTRFGENSEHAAVVYLGGEAIQQTNHRSHRDQRPKVLEYPSRRPNPLAGCTD